MNDTVITVENLSKRYRLGQIGATTLRETVERWCHVLRGRDPRHAMGGVGRTKGERLQETDSPVADADEIWALRDVSFEVKRGEVLGVIGANGAGKSTLLKILTRITEPSSGRAVMRGRVSSLLEVGTGFHPELTGRENTYLNGAILGMRKAEIDRKFDEIVAFAEVGKFVDTPVKRYSSGMYVRLAFAVAAYLDPEILLVDEVLAVGDLSFQKRCLGKMGDVVRGGRTVILVSHNMSFISGLCERCLYLNGGRIAACGETTSIVSQYVESSKPQVDTCEISSRIDREGTGEARFTSFVVLVEDRRVSTVLSGQDVTFRIGYALADGISSVAQVTVGMQVLTMDGKFLTALNSHTLRREFLLSQPEGFFFCRVPRFPLMYGVHHINLVMNASRETLDLVKNAAAITVQPGNFFGTGIHNAQRRQGVFLEHTWCHGANNRS